jgi:ATP-dependent RNA helicase RhlE
LTVFTDFGLRPELLKALAAKGYTTPTPVQAQAIPLILAGHDLLAGAQTGTGKTAAFALPMLHLLSTRIAAKPSRNPKALILTPTRELADQVATSFKTYGSHLKLRTVVIYGGVGFNPQADHLRQGVDLIVATPGRLLDHVSQRTVNLSEVSTFVLDEADRMLDMGFLPDMRRVMKLLPVERQNLLFSATYTKEIRTLAEGFLNNPKEVDVAPRNSTVELISQVVHPVPQQLKRALLGKLILEGDWRQVLVFTRTKHGANRLAEQLSKDGISAAAIHGNKSQGARTRALGEFKNGSLRVLVATDIASRGLDINQLPHVVNFELPNVPEEYVHRIGRTGRAGMQGTATALVCREESPFLRDIEKLIKRPIEVQVIEGFADQLIGGDGGPAPVLQQRGSRPASAGPRSPRRSAPQRQEYSPRGDSAEYESPSSPRPARAPRPERTTTRTDTRFEREEQPRSSAAPKRTSSPVTSNEQRSRKQGEGYSISRIGGKRTTSQQPGISSRPRRKRTD